MALLNIGTDFSIDPAGRYYTDGTGSGEEFREGCFRKKLDNLDHGEKLQIVLDDGIEGYGSSFLVEGFAGIVKYGYQKAEWLLDHISFKYDNEDFDFYEERIKQYISEAEFNSERYSPSQ